MKYFDYLFQSYKEAYKKSRYWFSILYILLTIQVWLQISLPGSSLLSIAPEIDWVVKFTRVVKTTLNPDSTKAGSIIIPNLMRDKFHYKLEGGYENPPDTNSAYALSVSNFLDSLVLLEFIDENKSNIYRKGLLKTVHDSVIMFRKEHVRRDSILKTKKDSIQNLSEERTKLFFADTKEFQSKLDSSVDLYFQSRLLDQINTTLQNIFEKYSTDSIYTYQTLLNVKKENFGKVKDILETNIIKNPYIDLPLKAILFLLILFIVSIIVFFYFSILIKYYSKLECKIENYSVPDGIKTPSIKNIFPTIEIFSVSDKIVKLIAFLFYSLLPLIIIGFYTKYLFSSLIAVITIIVVVSVKVIIWWIIEYK